MAIGNKDLKEDFYKDYGVEWKNNKGEPDIDYVLWLEDKIIDKAKETVSGDTMLCEVSSLTQKALSKWGKEFQIIIVIEELSELSKALCKSFRSDNHYDVIEEMADVIIMIEQLKLIYGNKKTLNERIEFKLNRLKERLEDLS